MSAGGKTFELIGGDVTLDLINTLDHRFRESGPEELLVDFDDLLQFLTQSGVLSASESRSLKRSTTAAESVKLVSQVRELRELLAHILYPIVNGQKPPPEAVKALELQFKSVSAHRVLELKEGRLVWKWPKALDSPEVVVWKLVQSAEELLLSDRISLLRHCVSGTCRWLFLDTSKNHTRRWCNMKICGNRMKAKRFHAKQIGTGGVV